MDSNQIKSHAPVDRFNSYTDKVKYIPTAVQWIYKYAYKHHVMPEKFTRGPHTADRERDHRVFQKDLTEFQLTGQTSLMSQWGNPHPKVQSNFIFLTYSTRYINLATTKHGCTHEESNDYLICPWELWKW